MHEVSGEDAATTTSSDTVAPTSRPDSEAGSVHVLTTGGKTRLVLVGEIDVALSADLAEAVAEAERAARPVEIDARRVTFMDSSGVTMLARLAHRTPGRLTMIQPPEVVRFLLEVTKIGEIVDVVDDEPEDAAPGDPDDEPPNDAA